MIDYLKSGNFTVPELLRLSMVTFVDAIISSRPPDAIIGPVSDPYVYRWHLALASPMASTRG